MDLGIKHYYFSSYSKELNNLSDEEIKTMQERLKAPWWNNLYRKTIHKNKRVLLIIYILMIRKDWSWKSLKQLYNIVTSKTSDK